MARKHRRNRAGRRVFISYRRKGGIDTARWLYDQLVARGYHVFMDLEGLRAGAFNQALYREIENSDVLLLVLSEGSLERCWNEGDWVRQEVAYALRCGLKIIPIMMQGFQFPAELPEDIAPIRSYQGLPVSYDFFDAFMEKLETYIDDSAAGSPERNYLAVGLAAALLLVGAFLLGRFLLAPDPDPVLPETTASSADAATEPTTEPTADSASEPTQNTETRPALPALSGNSPTNLCNGGIITLTPEKYGVALTSGDVHWLNMLITEPENKYFYESASRCIINWWYEDGNRQTEELIGDVDCHYLYVTSDWLYCVLEETDGSHTLYRAENHPETHSIGTLQPIVTGVLSSNRIAIRGDYAYYWKGTEGLVRCRTDGSATELLFDNAGSKNFFGLITFHVSEESVYFWASTGGVYSVPVTGGKARYLLNTNDQPGVPAHAVADEEYIYYVMEYMADGVRTKPAEIWRVGLDGTDNQLLAALGSTDMVIESMNIGLDLYLKITTGDGPALYTLSPGDGELKLWIDY